jgi:hypothetical protein
MQTIYFYSLKWTSLLRSEKRVKKFKFLTQSELMELRGFDDSPQKESAPTKKQQQQPQKQDGGTGTKARPEQKDGQFLTFFFCSGWKPTHLTSVDICFIAA